MSEYTKGKWKKQLYSNGYEIFADDEEETYIAGINEDNPNHKANAQLIETAPELLEAAEYIENHILTGGIKIKDAPAEICFKDLQKAIAKAKGD